MLALPLAACSVALSTWPASWPAPANQAAASLCSLGRPGPVPARCRPSCQASGVDSLLAIYHVLPSTTAGAFASANLPLIRWRAAAHAFVRVEILLVSRSNGLPGQGGHGKQALIRGSGTSRPDLPSCCYYIDEPGKILSNTRRVSRRQKDLLPGPVVSLCNDTQDKQQHLKIERGSRDCQPRRTELFS